MNARRLALVVAVATLLGSATYVFVYLQRWEWNRALMSGVFLLAAEVALVAVVLSDRMARLDGEIKGLRATVDDGRRRRFERIMETPPASRDQFAWLRRSVSQTNVFVPVLMGAGVVLSALAWLVERMARATAGPAMARGLAARLDVLAVPAEPLVPAPAPRDPRLGLLLAPSVEPAR